MSNKLHTKHILLFSVTMLLAMVTGGAHAQTDPNSRYRVVGGQLKDIKAVTPAIVDSLAADSLSVVTPSGQDSINAASDNLIISDAETAAEEKLSRRKLRALDTTPRYSALFRDTIPISRMTAISIVVPGFGQVYNKQAWKLPVMYGTIGTMTYFGLREHREYRRLKTQYNMLLNSGVQPWDMQHIQNPMIKHNTSRQILLGGAIVAYIYMVGDGVLNYNGPVNSVKKATTLSTILPGAGQMYNKSLWKVPIVVGGFATMAYIVDFNTRGYNRFKLAYNLVSAGEQDEFNGRYSAEYLKDLKNNYRRNRDLSIIITAGFYILNIVDAHVDAHLKDYDISDDLGVELYPYIDQLYTSRGMTNTVGMTMSFKF